MKQVEEIKFRCSSLGHLMSDAKSKTVYFIDGIEVTTAKYNKLIDTAVASNNFELLNRLSSKKIEVEENEISETAKTHCVDCYASWMFDRREEVYSKYLEKGTSVEEDAITLLSLHTKNLYFKNEDRLENDFIAGTPDLFLKDGDVISVVEDIKSSWDIFTFLRSKHKELNKNYYWQLMGYMWLTGAEKANLRYCLVNSTDTLIDDEKRKLAYAMKVFDNDTDPKYVEQCKQIEKNMIYDLKLFLTHYPHYPLVNDVKEWEWDVPREKRIHTIEIVRDDIAIERIKEKVKACREYIKYNLMV